MNETLFIKTTLPFWDNVAQLKYLFIHFSLKMMCCVSFSIVFPLVRISYQ
jgi:hypothetical protein